jgi:Zn-dependent protease
MNWPKTLRLVGSMVLFAVLVATLFQSWALAWMLTASLAVHECGHVVALRLLGVETEVGFGAAGAWTRSPAQQRHTMHHLSNSLAHLAGPAASLAYALLSVVLGRWVHSDRTGSHLLRLANLNALLALLNLLPMGIITDGGKAIKRVFTSLQEDVEDRVVWALVPWLASLLWLIVLVRRDLVRAVAVLLIGVWFAVQVLIERDRDDPAASRSLRAMNTGQAVGVLGGMIAALLVSTFAVVAMPFWLTQDEVFTMVARWTSLFAYLAWRSPSGLRVGLALVGLVGLYVVGRLVLGWTRKRHK